jgi:hypothetical protein
VHVPRLVLGVLCLALVLHLGMLVGGAHAPAHAEQQHSAPAADAGHLMLGVCLAVVGVGVGLLVQRLAPRREAVAVLSTRTAVARSLVRRPSFWPPGPGRDRVEAGLVLRV